ncbi:siderophore synthetase component [Neorhizobium sp. R1-B]|uniref:IucA/IucC family protein n=1 Tax=Neorhizobium sp. R1-B TaxID=2485162 RepID=UPI0010E2FD69|nr:IucA/IucC family protein [Neorhizobium sp. R1-B]TDX82114.1 siderophore synthetase component [Neorhizobium sp. R1-B]
MPLPLEEPGQARDRVIRQLVAALLFEGLLEARTSISNGEMQFDWSLGGKRFRCRGEIGAFGRLRIAPGSVKMLGSGNHWEPASLSAIVPDLPGTGVTRGRLFRELEQTVIFSDWNHDHIPPKDRRGMSFAALEGALDEGHPYHPCFRARLGFSLADHAAYSPEAGQPFQLVWLLIARKHLCVALPEREEDFWRRELGEETWADVEAKRRALPFPAEDFGIVPLHPWQWKDLGEAIAAGWIAAGEAHYLGAIGDRYTATQSVRSLINLDRPGAASIKLPLNIVNTSSRRTLEPHSVCTAPVLSSWVAEIVTGDPAFQERYPLTILQEYAGLIAHANGPLAGQIGAIWRQNAEATLQPGEAVIPFNALMMIEGDGRPFADEWITRFGLMPWMNRLQEVAILPVWHLLVRHGIAVEAHGQNMLLVHRDGWPVRLILRDFHESVEFSSSFLREPDKAPDFPSLNPAYRDAEPDQYYWTDNLDSLRELVMDTLFVFNLSEISHLLDVCYGLAEFRFWERVEKLLAAYAEDWPVQNRLAELRHDRPFIRTESLITRKLLAQKPEYHHEIPNALAAGITERRRKP